MSIAKITLLGMYQYMNDQNDPLFKNLSVPDGMDKDKLVNTILYKGAEFGVLYADPYFMQSMIKIWSDRYAHTLGRWIKALSIDYDPLENYDRREEWSDIGNRSKSGNVSNISTDIANNTTSNENSVNQSTYGIKTTDQTDENKVSAFNSSTYTNKDKTDTNVNNSDSTISATGGTGSAKTAGEQIRNENSSNNENEDHNNIHSGRLHGNIGVTTSQQMLQAELDIARFNLYDETADLFLSEFCIYIY